MGWKLVLVAFVLGVMGGWWLHRAYVREVWHLVEEMRRKARGTKKRKTR